MSSRFPKQVLLEGDLTALRWSQALSGMWTAGQTYRSRDRCVWGGGVVGECLGLHSLPPVGLSLGQRREQPWPTSQGCCEDGG